MTLSFNWIGPGPSKSLMGIRIPLESQYKWKMNSSGRECSLLNCQYGKLYWVRDLLLPQNYNPIIGLKNFII